MPFEIGRVVGDYEILEVLGKGGMGRVYRVRHIISNRVEAMKVLLADLAAEAELGERFLGEIRTLARLDHPNVAKLHTSFKAENQLVMVMELIEGSTLADLAKGGALPLHRVLSYVDQTLAALSYAHQKGVIHRDIKPSNIMVTPQNVVKLTDFGIAKSTVDPLLTRPGTTMGSLLYMSPEQVRGLAVDVRSDLYSVGVVLYELTAGRRPFEAESTSNALEAQLNTPPKPPIEVNPSLPPALNEIILMALQKDPARRFGNAEALRKALQSIQTRPEEAPTEVAPGGLSPIAAEQPRLSFTPSQLQGQGPARAQPAAQDAGASGPPLKKASRGLWMAFGAIVCGGVLFVAVSILPRFIHSSANSRRHIEQAPTVQPSTPLAAPERSPLSNPTSGQGSKEDRAIPAKSPESGLNPKMLPEARQSVITGKSAEKSPRQAASSINPAAAKESLQPVEQQPSTAIIPHGPPQEEIDKTSDDLSKLTARADAVRSSLINLRNQQQTNGLEVRQDVAAAASRMDNYLGAAQDALKSDKLDAARKNMERAEREITTLEAFFGR